MNIQKRIEIIDLVETLCGKPCDICKFYGKNQKCIPVITAEKLYAAGFRKATNIFSELEAMTEIHEFHDVEVGNWTEQYAELSLEDIADLKKKYEVDI